MSIEPHYLYGLTDDRTGKVLLPPDGAPGLWDTPAAALNEAQGWGWLQSNGEIFASDEYPSK